MPELSLFFARNRRRARILCSLGLGILRGHNPVRALTPAAWAFIAGGIWLVSDAGQVGSYAWPSLALAGCLIIVTLIDARYFIIPDGPLIFLAILGGVMRVVDGNDFSTAAAGAIMAYAFFYLIDVCFQKVKGRSCLGKGDALLFSISGIWLGMEGLPTCLLIAGVSGILATIINSLDGVSNFKEPVPFGPHLALGFWLTWTVGPLTI